MLGGSWVVTSGVISPLIRGLGFRRLGFGVIITGVISPLIKVITIVVLLITLLITTHEPPSGALNLHRHNEDVLCAEAQWSDLTNLSSSTTGPQTVRTF